MSRFCPGCNVLLAKWARICPECRAANKPTRQAIRDFDWNRAKTMAARFRNGETLQAIANDYNITRERIRQLIKKVGVVGKDGGQQFMTRSKNAIKAAKRDERYLKKHGCTYAQHRMLSVFGVGRTRETGPLGAFRRQKHSAANRGVEWKLKLWEWWQIWVESGKWSERGRGQGKYCMARHGDKGAYELGNVFICLAVENNSNRPQKKSGLPMGVHLAKGGKFAATKMLLGKSYHIGTFHTSELAHAAYLSFDPDSRKNFAREPSYNASQLA